MVPDTLTTTPCRCPRTLAIRPDFIRRLRAAVAIQPRPNQNRGEKIKKFLTVAIISMTELVAYSSHVEADGQIYEAHCTEPLPAFTLGEHSKPTKDQEAALCSCIWNSLGRWEREVSVKIVQGKESEVSWIQMQGFPTRFGEAITKCGGMKY